MSNVAVCCTVVHSLEQTTVTYNWLEKSIVYFYCMLYWVVWCKSVFSTCLLPFCEEERGCNKMVSTFISLFLNELMPQCTYFYTGIRLCRRTKLRNYTCCNLMLVFLTIMTLFSTSWFSTSWFCLEMEIYSLKDMRVDLKHCRHELHSFDVIVFKDLGCFDRYRGIVYTVLFLKRSVPYVA